MVHEHLGGELGDPRRRWASDRWVSAQLPAVAQEPVRELDVHASVGVFVGGERAKPLEQGAARDPGAALDVQQILGRGPPPRAIATPLEPEPGRPHVASEVDLGARGQELDQGLVPTGARDEGVAGAQVRHVLTARHCDGLIGSRGAAQVLPVLQPRVARLTLEQPQVGSDAVAGGVVDHHQLVRKARERPNRRDQVEGLLEPVVSDEHHAQARGSLGPAPGRRGRSLFLAAGQDRQVGTALVELGLDRESLAHERPQGARVEAMEMEGVVAWPLRHGSRDDEPSTGREERVQPAQEHARLREVLEGLQRHGCLEALAAAERERVLDRFEAHALGGVAAARRLDRGGGAVDPEHLGSPEAGREDCGSVTRPAGDVEHARAADGAQALARPAVALEVELAVVSVVGRVGVEALDDHVRASRAPRAPRRDGSGALATSLRRARMRWT